MSELEQEREAARVATGEQLAALLYHPSAEVLLALLDNPALEEASLSLLLARKDLPTEILEEIGRRKALLKNYSVKRALVFHPRMPRQHGIRLIRDLYLMDLVRFSLTPGVPAELKRVAEEQLLARLPQMALGQKITLARRGPGRVAGALVAEGHPKVVSIALNNPYLTESQLLKVLAREKLASSIVLATAGHKKWSSSYNIRVALVRHSSTPLATVLDFLPHIALPDLRVLASPGIVAGNLQNYLQAEIQRRSHTTKIHPEKKKAVSD
ncbi:MAG TPA: hypothetical protein VN982_10375 [Candidatus Dormibacteraeota bacterium]|nr:hypothetical protein [Candidatus Dormibacteraeota bacterium]